MEGLSFPNLGSAISLAVAAVVCSACSTAMVNLASNPPKAQVYAAALGGGVPRLVGETPLSLPATGISRDYGGSGPVVLEFRRPGYLPKTAIVTDLAVGDLAINMELQPTTGLDEADKLNTVIDQVFESQRLARVGRHDDAMIKLRAVELVAPQLAATYELQGGIYYLKKQYKEALDAYSQAVKFNPRNQESVRMRNLLELALGATRRNQPGRPDGISSAGGAKQ